MRKTMFAGLALCAIAAAGSGKAFGQDCEGKVKLDTVYGEGSPLTYKVQVRNLTGGHVTAELTFGGFPAGTTMKSLVKVSLNKDQNERYTIGSGTNQLINNSTVDFVYGRAAAPSKPTFVRVTSCVVK